MGVESKGAISPSSANMGLGSGGMEIGLKPGGPVIEKLVDLPKSDPQQLFRQYYYENAPMGGKIPPPGERPPVAEMLGNTSAHETQHALVARTYGLKASISLEPSGDSLARTSFNGSVPLSAFKVIAAAGAVDTAANGNARGFGHDLYQVAVANYLENGKPGNAKPYVEAAQAKLDANFPREIQAIAAELIAINGGTDNIDEILEQAYFEAWLNKIDFEKFYEEREQKLQIADQLIAKLAVENEMVEVRLIEDTNEHILKVQLILEDKPDEVVDTLTCPYCGGINLHMVLCTPQFRFRENLKNTKSLSERQESEFPDKGEIFNRNELLPEMPGVKNKRSDSVFSEN